MKNKYISLFIYSMALLIIFGSCNIGKSVDNGEPAAALVTVNFEKPSSRELTETVPSDVSDIQSVKLTVSAPDMETVEQTVDVTGDTVSISVTVPQGTERTFKAEAFDSNGNLIWDGTTVQDIQEDTVTLVIEMLYRGSPVYKYFAYVSNWGDDTITIADLNISTGALTLGTPFSHSNNPHCVGVHPSGQYAYIGYGTTPFTTVTNATVDKNTGSLTMGTTTKTGDKPTFIAVHPNGNFAYITSYTTSAIWVHPISNGVLGTGTSTTAESSGGHAIAIRPDGNFLYVAYESATQIEIFGINAEGNISSLGSQQSVFHSTDNVLSVAMHPNGTYLYATYYPAGCIHRWTINTDGTLSVPSETEYFFEPSERYESIIVHPSGNYLYLINSSKSPIELRIYPIDSAGDLPTDPTPSTTYAPGTAFHTINIGRTTLLAPAQ